MKNVRRVALAGASLVLATAGALAVSASPAQAAPACPATDSGFLISASRAGAAGVDTGTLYQATPAGPYRLTCRYQGRHWVAPTGGSLTYVGYCSWKKEWGLIDGWSGRRDVSCS
jgi:hypothetical protein